MTLAYPLLPEPLRFSEYGIQILVIEHAQQLRKAVLEMKEQISGGKGEFVFSEHGEIKELSKLAVLITDPFSLDFDAKRILTKINQEACRAGAEYEDGLQEILVRLAGLASDISMSIEFDVCFEVPQSGEELIKLMGFRVDTERMTVPEQVVEFMKIQRGMFGKKLFIFYNLRACFSTEELASFYKTVQYQKLNLLLIENAIHRRLPEYEKMIIIDEDLCIF